jgi:hypothetical protein
LKSRLALQRFVRKSLPRSVCKGLRQPSSKHSLVKLIDRALPEEAAASVRQRVLWRLVGRRDEKRAVLIRTRRFGTAAKGPERIFDLSRPGVVQRDASLHSHALQRNSTKTATFFFGLRRFPIEVLGQRGFFLPRFAPLKIFLEHITLEMLASRRA